MHKFTVYIAGEDTFIEVKAAGLRPLPELGAVEFHDENGETKWVFMTRNIIGWEVED